jgi:hypothetical protein
MKDVRRFHVQLVAHAIAALAAVWEGIADQRSDAMSCAMPVVYDHVHAR